MPTALAKAGRRVVRSLDDVPLVCTIDDVCAIYQRARSTVLRDVRNNTFTPAPFAERPYYWHKEAIAEDLRHKSAAAQERARQQLQNEKRAS
jgi:hypothetical protein